MFYLPQSSKQLYVQQKFKILEIITKHLQLYWKSFMATLLKSYIAELWFNINVGYIV